MKGLKMLKLIKNILYSSFRGSGFLRATSICSDPSLDCNVNRKPGLANS